MNPNAAVFNPTTSTIHPSRAQQISDKKTSPSSKYDKKSKSKYVPKNKKKQISPEAQKIKNDKRNERKEKNKLEKLKKKEQADAQRALNPPKPKMKAVLEQLKKEQGEDRLRIKQLEELVASLEERISKIIN